MQKELLDLLNQYLLLFPEEKQRQTYLIKYLQLHKNDEIVDWNNFDGHVVSSGFIYAKKENKFLVLYHNDLNTFLYPGGHIDSSDINPLFAAKREILEEANLDNLKQLKLSENELIPVDIDTHKIRYNERLNLPEHYHFDFRYLFIIDRIQDIKLDMDEMSDYKWIDIDELANIFNCDIVTLKIKRLLLKFNN